MLLQFILLQIVAHLIADFTFQWQKWSDGKSKKPITKYHFYHVLVVLVMSFLFSFDPNFWWAAISLAFLHLLVDILKSYLCKKSKSRQAKSAYFFADQFVHLIIIIFVSCLYSYVSSIHCIIGINSVYYIAVVAGFLFCAKPTNIYIQNILVSFSIETPDTRTENSESGADDEKSLPNAGKLIGITERFLTLALILSGQYGAVGLVIAAKSILRYNSAQKSEYILVGTLLSFGFATILGILITKLK
jgi:hypothetical protein